MNSLQTDDLLGTQDRPTQEWPQQVRVLRVIARLNVGGPTWQAVLLTAKTRRYPTVLATGQVGPNEADLSALAVKHRVPLCRVPGLGRDLRIAGDLRALWALWRLCRRLRPDIIHTHTAKAGTLGRIAGWLAGVPVRIHTFHGHVFHGYFSWLKTSAVIWVERLLARISTRIIAISPKQRDELKRYLRLTDDKVAVVPLGLDLEQFRVTNRDAARRQFREAIRVRDDEIVVSIVGRLTAIKNHSLALRACARVMASERRLVLALVGGGELEEALRTEANALGIADRVRFAGWWDNLAPVYYGSDVIALTSNNEGTPVCLIEALACKRPIIATNVGGVSDVLAEGKYGLLVAPNDETALARGLERFLDPVERAGFSDRAHDAAWRRYDVGRLVSDIEALYDTACAGTKVPRGRSAT